MDPDIKEDLEFILENNLRKINVTYACYVDTLRCTLEEKGVTPRDLRTYLVSLPAFSSKGQTLGLLSEIELQQCNTVAEIFIFLKTKCTSFLDFEIFENILDYFKISKDHERLKYCEHLETFIHKHKISEFVMVNPLLEKYTKDSEKLILKYNVEQTCRLAKVKNLKRFIAKILDLNPSALQIIDIEEGCVVVTFLIPASVANAVFTPDTSFAPQQEDELRANSVLRLECNGYTFNFGKENEVSTDSSGKLIVPPS